MKTWKARPLLTAWMLLPALVATAADPPAAKNEPKNVDSKKDEPNESTRVRYAKTYLALMRLDLQTARDRNKLVPNTLPTALMQVLEAQVALAERWLQEAEHEGQGGRFNVAVESAEIYVKLAEADYARGIEVDRIRRMKPQALERLKIKAELARLNLATAKELDPSSPTALLEFQLDRLREEVTELKLHQLEILDRN